MTDRPDLVYCSDCSRRVGERLFATALRGDIWLLLEYGGPWGAKALPESDLAPDVKARLQAWLDATPRSKFLFIKQRDGQTDGPRLYAALIDEVEPRLYRLDLTTYDDLLALDLESLTAGSPAFAAYRSRELLLAVCVNGRRDIACAKYGTPVYYALAEQEGVSVWQCTHMGGHRFAGVAAALPSGVCYGYLDPDDASDLARAVRQDDILLGKTRGRSCYDAPVQAADYFLRGVTGVTAVDGLRLRSHTPVAEDQWVVRFDVQREGRAYDVTVRHELSAFTTYESSGDATPKHVPQYHLVSHSPAE